MTTRMSARLSVDEKEFAYKTISVTPLNPVVGAEIEGVDLGRTLSDEQLSEIRQASLDHHVLVFCEQRIAPDERRPIAANGELQSN